MQIETFRQSPSTVSEQANAQCTCIRHSVYRIVLGTSQNLSWRGMGGGGLRRKWGAPKFFRGVGGGGA